MKVSINSIKGFNTRYNCAQDIAPNGIDDLASKVGSQLGAIEEVIDFGSKYAGVLIVKVMTCEDHPNADRLHVCTIDDGGVATGVDRDEHGYVQVVCGAPNVREGLTVAWLPPGSTVPETFTSDPFVLSSRELRGVVSNGMLASPKELALGDSHDGILEIDRSDIAPGTTFVDAFELDGDVVFDIENKMFTHRPDCFGIIGVDRELAGIQQLQFNSPEWYTIDPTFPEIEAEQLPLVVENHIPHLVPRITAIAMSNVKVGPSPVWLQIELAKAGMRSINNIVDYTNLFMLETGQPIHAYDYDKVLMQDTNAHQASLIVRHPAEDESITLLNGKKIQPRDEAIMIATRDALIGVGGVMGGADTEVDTSTTRIIIEVASFDMYSIRKTSMTHGLFTDAVTRFSKGQSPHQTKLVIAKIVDEIRRFAQGKVASSLIDVKNELPINSTQRITTDFVNKRLGIDLSSERMAALLGNVEFEVSTTEDSIIVTAPFWRTDIAIPEDIVEEIGRLYGYDKLPLDLPLRTARPTPITPHVELKTSIRNILKSAGANEALTYSFVHGDLLRKVGQDSTKAFQLSNAISPDLQYYRLSVLPSLLDKVHMNIKSGHNLFALYELGLCHVNDALNDAGLPVEPSRLALVFASKTSRAGAAFYHARLLAEHLITKLGIEGYAFGATGFETEDSLLLAWKQPFDPARSVAILANVQGRENTLVGFVGEFTRSTRKALKLPDYSAGFELDTRILSALLAEQTNSQYKPLPKFPKIEQDVCLRVPDSVSHAELRSIVMAAIEDSKPEQVHYSLKTLDIFQREDDDKKHITFRLSIASYLKTMRDEEVKTIIDHIVTAASTACTAELV